ncbi:hypothetical protein ACFVJH_12340 [Streptomyces decoyicus]|uniref:hypothetical protein n=1 Tax=Streptomyces decoyicus TaxID=249567 RepID=UPI0036459BE6
MNDADAIAALLCDAELLDGLRREEKELAERIERVREKIAAGEAVLAAVERWRQVATLPRAVSAGAPEAAAAAQAAGVGADPPLIEQIALLLAQDPDRVWSPEEVHRALGASPGSVHSALSRLEQRGRDRPGGARLLPGQVSRRWCFSGSSCRTRGCSTGAPRSVTRSPPGGRGRAVLVRPGCGSASSAGCVNWWAARIR